MKRIVIGVFMAIAIVLFAEDWNNELTAGLNLSFNNYSDNWAGEEASNIVWSASLNGLAEKQLSSMFNLRNTLKMSFGQTSNRDTAGWQSPMKSSDIIDIESILRVTLGWFADPFAGLRMESHFTDTRDTASTAFVNPTRITESFGLARVLYKTEKTELSMRMGGAIRQSIDYMAVDSAGSRMTDIVSDGGVELTAECNMPLLGSRVQYTGKFTLYKALFNSNAEALSGTSSADDWKAVDMYNDNIFTAKITDYIDINLNVQMLYDREIDSGLMHKGNLILGINYRFL